MGNYNVGAGTFHEATDSKAPARAAPQRRSLGLAPRRGLFALGAAALFGVVLPLVPSPRAAEANIVLVALTGEDKDLDAAGEERDDTLADAADRAASLADLQSSPHALGKAPTSASASTSCISCHRFEAALSHPVNIAPSMPMPEGWQLEDGKLTCLTCHDSAASRPDHARRTGNALLRDDTTATTSCTQCHTRGSTGSSHATVSGWAHLTSVDKHHPRRASRPAAGSLDSESNMCVSCHDGTIAGDAGTHPSMRSTKLANDHPIGVKYARIRPPTEDKINLVPRAALDRRVRLFDENLGCGSCHSVYSKNDHLLVMNNLRSKLCLACHAQ
jgi:hypothetical protein